MTNSDPEAPRRGGEFTHGSPTRYRSSPVRWKVQRPKPRSRGKK